MKKKLKRELNKLLPKGFSVSDKAKLRIIPNLQETQYNFRFNVEKQPSKDELLEKAKRDYPEGTIFKGKLGRNFTSTCNFALEGSNFIHNSSNGCIYYNGKWAEIIKNPVIKVQDKWLYEGDEYWDIIKPSFQLKKGKVLSYQRDKYHESGLRFTTKQNALDFVLKEAKERFRGCKKVKISTDNIVEYESVFIDKQENISINPKSEDYYWCAWQKNMGWSAEPIKGDVPEWVKCIQNSSPSYTKGKLYPCIGIKYEFDGKRYVTSIDDEGLRHNGHSKKHLIPATKAEIEAHKLGFHIGDEVYYKPTRAKIEIKSFEYGIYNDMLRARFTDNSWGCIDDIIKEQPKPKLMLGEYEVEISSELIHFDGNVTIIKCNGGQVTIEEWMRLYDRFINAKKYADSFIINIDLDMAVECKEGNIFIGCIEDVTIDQIKMITDRLNEL